MKNKIEEVELLPAHYIPVSEPNYFGRGHHSVAELEEICEKYKEFVHQLKIREQSILKKTNSELVHADKSVPNGLIGYIGNFLH